MKYFNVTLMMLTVLLFSILMSFSCSRKGEENKFSIGNIIVATWHIVNAKGITSVSGEEVNAEIERMYNSVDDVLQKKSSIRQRGSDNSNDYQIIYEDEIFKEKEKKERNYKDPLKK
jgi:hypothetical protein